MIAEKTKRMHLSDLHFEHNLWTMEANFYSGELEVYQKWLQEIAAKNTKEPVRKLVEHFQNQFIIQNKQLDLLRHDIKSYEQWLARYAEANPVAVDHRAFSDHAEMRLSMRNFKRLYADLKMEFMRFVEECM